MKKKSELHYELYGSSAGAGEKGYWRWAIFTGREKNQSWLALFMARCRMQRKMHKRQYFVSRNEHGSARRLRQSNPTQRSFVTT